MTMLQRIHIDQLAAELNSAEQQGVPMEQLSKRFPDMTIDDGYRVSRAWVDLKLKAGQKIRGHKIGLTSQAMRKAVGLNDSDYGTLLDQMFFEEGGDIPLKRFISPRVEAELAFVLHKPLRGPGVTIFDVLAATDYVTPAIEIIDSRVQRVDPETKSVRRIEDTIADNAANAGIILGGRPTRPDAFDWRWAAVAVSRNGVIEETGLGSAVLNHPANGIAWLANRLAPWNEHLEPGQVVLGGSFIRPVEIAAGDVFHADFGPLGSIGFRFI